MTQAQAPKPEPVRGVRAQARRLRFAALGAAALSTAVALATVGSVGFQLFRSRTPATEQPMDVPAPPRAPVPAPPAPAEVPAPAPEPVPSHAPRPAPARRTAPKPNKTAEQQKSEASGAITYARGKIGIAEDAGKNVSIARDQFTEAETEFNAGRYDDATRIARNAARLAVAIMQPSAPAPRTEDAPRPAGPSVLASSAYIARVKSRISSAVKSVANQLSLNGHMVVIVEVQPDGSATIKAGLFKDASMQVVGDGFSGQKEADFTGRLASQITPDALGATPNATAKVTVSVAVP